MPGRIRVLVDVCPSSTMAAPVSPGIIELGSKTALAKEPDANGTS
jgi:hypothetical protein